MNFGSFDNYMLLAFVTFSFIKRKYIPGCMYVYVDRDDPLLEVCVFLLIVATPGCIAAIVS